MIPASLSLKVYKFQAVAIAVAVAFFVGTFAGGVGTWRVMSWMDTKATLKHERAATKAYVAEDERQHDIGVRHSTRQRALQETFEAQDDDYTTLVERNPHWADVDIGPDGLCRWNAWNEGKTPALAGCRSVGDLPGFIAEGEERPIAGPGAEPQGERAAVPPGVHAAEQPDRSGDAAPEN
jgi:hypothetical protein